MRVEDEGEEEAREADVDDGIRVAWRALVPMLPFLVSSVGTVSLGQS